MLACCIKHVNTSESEIYPKSQREIWLGKLDFFVSVMGFNIGLGNLLRFPYLCMRNGGGAFLLPYTLFLFIIGIPMFLMEMSLGQYSGLTPIEFYGNISPVFKGIGWCNIIACGIYNLYYNMLIAWIILYIGRCFNQELPWSSCNNEWNTKLCANSSILENRTQQRVNDSCPQEKLHNSPAEEFWEYNVLNLSPGIGTMGNVNWITFICLLLSWIFVFLCLVKGIKSMGKVVYVTALSPYILIIILLVKGALLEGSSEGIKYYLYPRMQFLLDPRVWMEAGQQIFWSLAPGWGITINLASHNRFHHNIYRDSLVLPIVSCLTSFLGGFVIFSFIGHISNRLGVSIECIFKVGPGLAFIVYPEVIQLLPIPQFWCLMFFLLLFALGLDSSFTSFETVYDSIINEYWTGLHNHDMTFKISLIVISFVISFPFVTQAGYYMFQLIDYYQIALFPLIILIEVLVIGYIYSIKRLKANIKKMTGYTLTKMWDVVYKILLPITLMLLLIFTVTTQTNLEYGKYVYPKPAIAFGWILAILGTVPLFSYAIYFLVVMKISLMDSKSIFEIIKIYIQPTPRWNYEENLDQASPLLVLNETGNPQNIE